MLVRWNATRIDESDFTGHESKISVPAKSISGTNLCKPKAIHLDKFKIHKSLTFEDPVQLSQLEALSSYQNPEKL